MGGCDGGRLIAGWGRARRGPADLTCQFPTIRSELGVGVLIVEQNLDFAWAFADHYFVMQRGRIVQQGLVANTTTADIAHLIQV